MGFLNEKISLGYLKNYFIPKGSRDKSVFKNISQGFVAKGISVVLSFLQVPVTLSLLSKSEYGVWITLFSVVGWLSFFDIGLGNGFRNKLTEALANNNIAKAKKIVSTTYFTLAAIFSTLILVFFALSFFIPWERVFQSPPQLQSQLYIVVLISVVATSLNFVAALIHTVLAAFHKTGRSSMLALVSQAAILLILLAVSFIKVEAPFVILASILSVIPLVLNIALNIFYFTGEYKHIAPSAQFYQKKYLKELMHLGLMFFVIQVAVLVMYTTDNLIITQLFGPEQVVTYGLVYRYYSFLYILFGIITTPLWTMFVNAYHNNDIQWINKSVKNLVRLFYSYIGIIGIMLLVSGPFFVIWIGSSFKTPFILHILVAVYVLLLVWGNIWVLPLNAMGKIKVQMIISLLQAAINIPIIFAVNFFLKDLSSVVLGNIICVVLGSGYMYYYYKNKSKRLTQTVH